MKTEWRIPKFIDLVTFKDPSKGYLINDACVFGAEVFVLNATTKGDCLSLIHRPVKGSYTWKFGKFSSANLKLYESQPFGVGNYKWYI